jgi:hypothetical protein
MPPRADAVRDGRHANACIRSTATAKRLVLDGIEHGGRLLPGRVSEANRRYRHRPPGAVSIPIRHHHRTGLSLRLNQP